MQLRPHDITWREIDGELVVLDLASSTYLTANRSATVLLRALREEQSLDGLVDLLVDHFGVTRAVARADVETFADTLAEAGLLHDDEQPTESGSPPHA